jgi:hypothetical protein
MQENKVTACFLAMDIDGNGEVKDNELYTSSDSFELLCVSHKSQNLFLSQNLSGKLKKIFKWFKMSGKINGKQIVDGNHISITEKDTKQTAIEQMQEHYQWDGFMKLWFLKVIDTEGDGFITDVDCMAAYEWGIRSKFKALVKSRHNCIHHLQLSTIEFKAGTKPNHCHMYKPTCRKIDPMR